MARDKVINIRKTERDDDHSPRIEAWKETNRKLGLDMKLILKPVLYGMAIAGCYNFMDVRQTGTNVERRHSVKSALCICYRIIIFVVFCLSICRSVAACFYVSTGFLTIYVQFVAWLVYNLATFIIFVKATSRKYGHNEKANNFWMEKIVPLFDQLCIEYPEMKLKKRATMVVILCIISVPINILGAYLQTNMANFDLYFLPFEKNIFTLSIGLAIFGAGTLVWLMPVATIVIFSMFLTEAFLATNQYLKSLCENQNLESFQNFETVRLLHLNLCSMVGNLDEDLKWYFATSVVFNVWSCIFILYQIMLLSMDKVLLILFSIWFMTCVFNLTMSILYAALLHEMVSTQFFLLNISIILFAP